MPANNLQGLNIVHPAQDPSDSQDLLLGQAYPDLTAQLDLWTNLSFDSEDHLAPRHDEHKNSTKYLVEEEEEEVRSPITSEKAVRDGHVNVVGPTNVSTDEGTNSANPSAAAAAAAQFDFNTFLAGFGIDAFTAHPNQLQQQQPATVAPSLAQLLALHPGYNPSYSSNELSPYNSTAPAHTFSRSTPAAEESSVPAKRSRTRKASVSTADSPEYLEEGSTSGPGNNTSTPLSPSEDKRRRNTAASARFRLKKKEREAALEGKAKELETKVTELERECEGLRRENGWLKGLVVGVTGAAQGPSGQGLNVTSPPPGPISTGTKRRREETETA